MKISNDVWRFIIGIVIGFYLGFQWADLKECDTHEDAFKAGFISGLTEGIQNWLHAKPSESGGISVEDLYLPAYENYLSDMTKKGKK